MKTRLLFFSLFGLSFGSGGNWVLSDYAIAASDSLSMAQTYGIQTFKNPASTVSVTAGGGSIVFKAKYGSDGTEGYTANVGLLHALTPSWEEIDISSFTGITFEYKNSAKITEALAVSFGSGTYSEAVAKAGTVYENTVTGATALGINTTWRTASLDAADFATPKWWTKPADFPSFAEVLKRVKNIQIAPKTLYSQTGTQNGTKCSNCVGPDMSELTLEVRNLTLKNAGPYPTPNPTNLGCEAGGAYTLVDDFLDGDARSKLGGYWYTFSDSGSAAVAADMADKSKGSSKAAMAVKDGYIQLNANLNKKLGGTWHDFAGWAALGLAVGDRPDSTLSELQTLTGISFQIQGVNIGKNVQAISFKAASKGVSDTATHFAWIPVEYISKEGGAQVCVRPEDLKQPSYLQAAHKSVLNPAKITKLAWEAKITDQRNSLIDTATAEFLVTDVKFHGATVGVRQRPGASAGLVAQMAGGVMHLKGFQDFQGFEVRTLDGSRLASFAPAPQVPLALPRGSYFLVGRSKVGLRSLAFTVAR